MLVFCFNLLYLQNSYVGICLINQIFMRKITLLMTLLAFVVGFQRTNAEVVSPYLEKFDGLAVSNHEFAPPGWGHIVASEFSTDTWETLYVPYSNPSSGGQDGAYLKAGSQELSSGWGSGTIVYDLLVTPPVTGDVSLYVKKNGMSGQIKFYKCSYQEGQYKKGAEYSVILPELSDLVWTKVTIRDVPAGTLLGIWCDNVSIDEFSAASAVVELRKELALTTVNYPGKSEVDADASGNATLSFEVTVTNKGQTTFNPGDAGYSLDVVTDDGTLISTQPTPIGEMLAPGQESSKITVTATFPVPESLSRDRYDIRENIGGTTKFGSWIEVFAYKPRFDFAVDTYKNVLEENAAVDFGTVNAPVTKTFFIVNDGAAPLNVAKVTMPEGFKLKSIKDDVAGTPVAAFPAEVSGKGRLAFEVEFAPADYKTYSGMMTVEAGGFAAKNVVLSGINLDPSLFYAPFDDGKIPVGCYFSTSDSGSVNWEITGYAAYEDNMCAVNSNSTEMTKFILPKMTFSQANPLTFKAAKRDNNSSRMKVYYSADKKEWTLARSFESADFSNEEYTGAYYDNFKYKSFTLNIPDGDWYIAFEAGYVRVDEIVGGRVVEGLEKFVLDLVNMPQSAMVNNLCEMEAMLVNIGGTDYADGALKAIVLMKGQNDADWRETPLYEQALPALKQGGRQNFTVGYVPHAVGAVEVKLVLQTADGSLVQELPWGSFDVAAETVNPFHQVGENTTTTSAPIAMNWSNTDTEMIYPASLVNLAAGTVLKGISFKGRKNSAKEHKVQLSVWIENTTETAPKTDDLYPTDAMKQVYNGEYQLGGGEGEFSVDVDLQSASFAYSGENLRIVVKSRTIGDYSNGSFYADAAFENNAAMRRKDSAEPEGSLSSATLPVLYLMVDKEVKMLSGTVIDDSTEAPVDGVKVTLKSGDVVYSSVTDSEGKYSMNVFQDNLTYDLSAEATGYLPFSESKVSVAEGSLVKAIRLVDMDGKFVLRSIAAPEAGEVNSAVAISAVLLNGSAKAAGSYAAKLYVNGQVVAEAESVALAELEEKQFEFVFTPHKAGNAEVYVEFSGEGYNTVKSQTLTVAVAEEVASAEKQVGSRSKFSSSGPVAFFFKASQTEIIYPAEKLGINPGTVIKSLKFKGHSSKVATFEVKAWMGNVPAGTALSGLATDGLAVVFDGIKDSVAAGDEDSPEVMLEIPLANGFVYEGGDIRLVLTSLSDSWASVYFEMDESVTGQAQQRAKDSSTLEELNNMAWDALPMPVVYLGLDPFKTISGKVTDAKTAAPVAGAQVTLKSGGVEYYATTLADGTYSGKVIKTSLSYDMTVVADGYKPYAHATQISFAGGDVVADVVLEKEIFNTHFAGAVYEQGTQVPVAGATVELTPADGGASVFTATTSDNGRFAFDEVPAAAYSVRITCPGYEETVASVDLTSGPVTIADFELAPAVFGVTGNVVDKESRVALADVSVQLMKDGKVEATATTAADGKYTIENVRLVETAEWTILFKKKYYENCTLVVDLTKLADGVVTVDAELQALSSVGSLTAEGMRVYGAAGCVWIESDVQGEVRVFNAAGVMVRSLSIEAGKQRIEGLNAGVYVVNGVKVVVR